MPDPRRRDRKIRPCDTCHALVCQAVKRGGGVQQAMPGRGDLDPVGQSPAFPCDESELGGFVHLRNPIEARSGQTIPGRSASRPRNTLIAQVVPSIGGMK